jgi:hypothetical protein
MPQHLFLEKLPKFNNMYKKIYQWWKSSCVQNFGIMIRRMYNEANIRDLKKREKGNEKWELSTSSKYKTLFLPLFFYACTSLILAPLYVFVKLSDTS